MPKDMDTNMENMDLENHNITGVERINWGTLAQVPEICINSFKNLSQLAPIVGNYRVFFLTHCDHETMDELLNSTFLEDLENYNGHRQLFMHRLSFWYLLHWATTGNVVRPKDKAILLMKLKKNRFIVCLKKNEIHQFEFERTPQHPKVFFEKKSVTYEVTALSSGHDIGSIMLMIESLDLITCEPLARQPSNQIRILFTGNCRLNMKDLANCKPLFHCKGMLKNFTHLYLDTTFFTTAVAELPSRRKVTQQLIKCIYTATSNENKIFGFLSNSKRYPGQPGALRSLRFYEQLMSFTDWALHVTDNVADFLKGIAGFKNCSSTNGESTPLHFDCQTWCGSSEKECCSSSSDIWSHKNGGNLMEVSLGCDINSDEQSECTMDDLVWNGENNGMYTVEEPGGVKIFRGIYSSHLSRNEAVRMIQFLGVPQNSIIPLYKPKSQDILEMNSFIRCVCSHDKPGEPKEIEEESASETYDFANVEYRF